MRPVVEGPSAGAWGLGEGLPRGGTSDVHREGTFTSVLSFVFKMFDLLCLTMCYIISSNGIFYCLKNVFVCCICLY